MLRLATANRGGALAVGFKYAPEVDLGYPDESTPYLADDEQAFQLWQRLYLQRWLENLETAASRSATTEELRAVVWELAHIMRRLCEGQGWELVKPPALAVGVGQSRPKRRLKLSLRLLRLR
ncbi:MAG: hypothetical protein C4315_01935 [Chloroflexota bacterium]